MSGPDPLKIFRAINSEDINLLDSQHAYWNKAFTPGDPLGRGRVRYTAVQCAFVLKKWKVARYLLSQKYVDVTINATNGSTTLMLALEHESPHKVIVPLLKRGADVTLNQTDLLGQTALDVAAEHDSTNHKYLLSLGAKTGEELRNEKCAFLAGPAVDPASQSPRPPSARSRHSHRERGATGSTGAAHDTDASAYLKKVDPPKVETAEVETTEVETAEVEAAEVEAAEVETAEVHTAEVGTAEAEIANRNHTDTLPNDETLNAHGSTAAIGSRNEQEGLTVDDADGGDWAENGPADSDWSEVAEGGDAEKQGHDHGVDDAEKDVDATHEDRAAKKEDIFLDEGESDAPEEEEAASVAASTGEVGVEEQDGSSKDGQETESKEKQKSRQKNDKARRRITIDLDKAQAREYLEVLRKRWKDEQRQGETTGESSQPKGSNKTESHDHRASKSHRRSALTGRVEGDAASQPHGTTSTDTSRSEVDDEKDERHPRKAAQQQTKKPHLSKANGHADRDRKRNMRSALKKMY